MKDYEARADNAKYKLYKQRGGSLDILPGLTRNALYRAGYVTRAQVAAVPDEWLLATVRLLGKKGVQAIRKIIPYDHQPGVKTKIVHSECSHCMHRVIVNDC
jgi:hypothetical protein